MLVTVQWIAEGVEALELPRRAWHVVEQVGGATTGKFTLKMNTFVCVDGTFLLVPGHLAKVISATYCARSSNNRVVLSKQTGRPIVVDRVLTLTIGALQCRLTFMSAEEI